MPLRALSCLALASWAIASSSASPEAQRLAVVVPAHAGDLPRAVSALDRWPTTCSPVTQENVDLVLYYAEGDDDPEPATALETISSTAGRCFANTKLVFANLDAEEDVYPKGPSIQFYKMFLDDGVKADLAAYDAFAIIEWDVLVASDRSFAELYRAAFENSEDFWVKGSNLEGTNFHSVAESSEMWHVMGHINGNAIYNNNDPVFSEFVEYTLARWEYKYPYDVALWATIADFPYSWPLWQRYSSKFVTTNLISNVGFEHVDSKTVSDAVAGETLFIHGSSVDTGNLAVLKAAATTAAGSDDLLCKSACDEGAASAGTAASVLPSGTSTICDPTCTMSDSRFGGHLCGVGDSDKYGPFCRLCYTDVEEAREAEKQLSDGLHVIMCDTRRPPPAPECSDECGAKKDTVCDATCGTGLHGDYNCNWRGLGDKCRFCFRDIETALAADEVAKLHGGRVVMCDTHEPPVTPDVPNGEVSEAAATNTARRLTDEPKWKTNQKWKGDDDTLPKWQQVQKWKRNRCLDGCERTSSNGTKGRVCDSSCETGEPYGRLGCSAKQGQFGRFCRTCYNDIDLAMAADTADDRAIMCDTLKPPTAYDRRQLSAVSRELTSDEHEPNWKTNQKWKTNEKWKGDDDEEPKWKTVQKWKRNTCSDGCERTSSNGTKGRVCDSSCETGEPYGRLGCSAKQGQFGRFCRTCYNDIDLAMAADTSGDRAIMCDTLEPPTAYDRRQLSTVSRELTSGEDQPTWKTNQKWKTNEKWKGDDDKEPKWKTAQKWKRNTCLDGCERTSSNGTKGRVCDSSCETGEPYGRLGCSAKQGQYGRFCRTCYNDIDLAMAADTADDRAIMCDTLEPPTAYDRRQLSTVSRELTSDGEEPKWKTNQKWKTNEKWKGDDDEEPKWKTVQKWKRNTCLDGCERTSSNGTKGRVCDSSCETGEPYGRLGCSAKQGQFGRFCRTCYNDIDLAMAADTADDRAIMCDTLEPPSAYNRRQLSTGSRQLTSDGEEPKWKTNQKWKTNEKWKGDDDEEPKWKTAQKWKRNTCLDGCERTSSNGTKGRVCDSSCETGEPYGKLGCSAKQGQYGRFCRTCYNDIDLAMAADTADDRAIMCGTLEPPSAYDRRQLSAVSRQLTSDGEEPKWKTNQKWKTNEKWKGDDDEEPKWKTVQKWKRNTCLDGCERTSSNGTKGRVCDSSCETGEPYGRLGCSAKAGQFGRFCRTCYNDIDLAMAADTADDRAIMCDTLEPPTAYNRRQLTSDEEEPTWKTNQKWKTNEKWKGDDDEEPKWKTAQKWKRNTCLDGCERTSSNGTKGRVCDSSCETGEPYGRLGCSAKQGQFGRFCRTCYNDIDLAMAADTADDRAIMCDTLEPVSAYNSRRLSRSSQLDDRDHGEEGEFEWYMRGAADTAFTHDVKRGEICAFIQGGPGRLQQTEVTVQSILEFVPGIRVAVATEPGSLAAYESAVGFYTGVRVSSTPNADLSALFADQHCGEGTKLVLYMRLGSVLSRSFTSKDTHTPRGDLVVIYGDARQSYRDAEIARETAAVLGFDAPSFTYGTDLLLPVGANEELRTELHVGHDEAAALSNKDKWEEFSSVPQLLAALAYSRNPVGVHFVNPQAWVTQNLFKQTSIWDIPLMKPRYACTLPESPLIPPSLVEDDAARADVLERSLEFFRMGGSCEDGIITVDLP